VCMKDSMIYKLVFYPISAEYIPDDWQTIKESLRSIGFIGKAIEDRQTTYLVGERFLQLITFLGCSPQIQLAPEAGTIEKFCYIGMSDFQESVHFKSFSRDVGARCPKCRKKFDV